MAVSIWFDGLISRFNRPYSPLPLILFASKRLSPLILFERVTSGDGGIDTCFRDIELNVYLCFGTPTPLPLRLVVLNENVLVILFSGDSRVRMAERPPIVRHDRRNVSQIELQIHLNVKASDARISLTARFFRPI